MATPTYVTRVAAILAIVAGFVAVFALPAQAQDQEDDRIAAVDIELLRSANGATVLPVRITVVSSRALDAVLEVEVNQLNLRWEFPIALAANSEVEQLIAIPIDAGRFEVIDATLSADGEVLDDDRQNGREANDNAVGLLGIEAPGDEVQLVPDTGKASLIEMNDLRLVNALDTVVTSPAGLRGLTADEQVQLMSWLASGRQLVVADEIGTIDAILPSEWHSSREISSAGSGVIRYVGTNWIDQVPAGPMSAGNANFIVGGFDLSGDELLNDGGFRVPGIGLLAIVLLVYLVVAGPITFTVLSLKKKQTYAWIILPALAVLFTGGVFVAGRLLNSGRTNAYASVVEINPVGASVTDSILVAKSGRRSIEIPQGWSLAGTGVQSRFGEGGRGAPITIKPSRTETELQFEIDPGSGGTAVLDGFTADATGALSLLDLQITEDELRGTVRNASGERLENVTVLVGARMAEVGTIDNDSTASFSLNLALNPGRFAPELRSWDVDPRDFNNFGFRDDNEATLKGSANGTAWLLWRAANFGSDVPDGLVTAVGWSRDLDYSAIDGTGRTALVARHELPASNGPLVPAQVRQLRMRTPGGGNGFDGFDGGFEGGFQGSTMVTQFVRPPGGDASELTLDLSRNVSELSVWIDGEWRPFELEAQTGPEVVIPDEAWQGDTLTVEYNLGEFFGDPNQIGTNLLPRTDRSDAPLLLEAGEDGKRQAQFQDNFNDGPEEAFEGVISVIENPDAGSLDFQADGVLEGTFDTWQIDVLEGDSLDIRMNAGGFGNFGGDQLDPELVLLDADGSQIAQNDDFDGLNSRIEFTASEDGQLQIITRSLSGSRGGGPYQIIVTLDREEGTG